MKRLLQRVRMSTYARYVLSYLSLLVLILTGLFGYMYFYVDGEVRQRAQVTEVNRLSRIAYRHEDYLSTMLNTALQMGLSPFIEPFAYEAEPAKAYDLLRQMAPYTVTNGFCEQMYLCFATDDHLYSSASSMTLAMFTDLMRYERVSADELTALIRHPGRLTILPAQEVQSPLIDGSPARVVTFLMPLGVDESKGSMLFMMKESVYADMFADAIEDKNNTYVFHGGELMASATDFDLPADVVLRAVEQLDDTHSASFTYAGEEWRLIGLDGADWGLRYATVLRASDITRSVRQGLWRIVVLLLALSTVGVTVALLLARLNVKPIREITGLLPTGGEGADELKAIQTGIRELSARNSDLATRLEHSAPMQRHDFVLRFMKGRYATREEAVATAATLGMSIDKPYYAVVLSGVQDHNDQPLDLRRPPFDSLADTVGFGAELVALSAHMYLLFSEKKEQLRRAAELIREAGMENSGHAVVALSGIQTDFASAPTTYLEAAAAYDNRFIMGENGLLDYSAISTSIEDILPKARKITDGINQALLLRNRAMLSGKMDELLHFLKHTSMSPFAFRLIYNDAIDTLLREHADALATGRNPQEMYDIFSLSGCQSVDDLDALLRKLCDGIIQAENEPTEPLSDEEPSAIAQVVSYMTEHFTDPELSISAIAEAFAMPTARLSLAFKELTRVSPLEYLTLLRVERSKELLSQTDLSIKEIAAQVGYYDASGFIRRFKQMTGTTPSQYRRNKEESTHDEPAQG